MNKMNDKKILALIPARGGSKGIKDKNIISVSGKPLISYTIRTAIDSGVFEDVVVTTDSERIAAVAKEHGADVPFLRPAELADDESKSMDVVMHAISWAESQKRTYDYLMLLQPTSPLRSSHDIISAVDLCAKMDADSIISVVACEHSPRLAGKLPENGSMEGFFKDRDVVSQNRQEYEAYYRLNGAIYLANMSKFKESGSWYMSRTYAYKMPAERSVDIDAWTDLKYAEVLLMENK
jgi:CMP-N,N'-diacetyllegionaminic acid synthase